MVALNVNGNPGDVAISDDMPFVWTLRDLLGMTGMTFDCGTCLCCTCTIHIDGQPTPSCITPISAAATKSIVTIEIIRPGKS
jgi:isoquinoline 1-oxidoreductase alpha subunit